VGTPTSRIPGAVKRLFAETFAARDVAEPLASFDESAPAREVRACLQARDFDVAGVRSDGHVVGYVEREALDDGACGRYRRQFDEAAVLTDDAPLLTVLTKLDRAPFLFVAVLGRVGGILTPADLHKPPVRMWLFGIVTMIEMRFSELIERHCPADAWKGCLSEARLQKAQALLAERRRRNQTLGLLDCLQFSDKGQIIARNDAIRKFTVFSSRRQAEEAVKQLERLRNNLAHAQDLESGDWAIIVQLCEFIARD
jgi:hypothetical protein